MLEAYAAEVACLQESHQACSGPCSGPRQVSASPAACTLSTAQSLGINSCQQLPGSLACRIRSTHVSSEQQRAIHRRCDVGIPCNSGLATAAAAAVASAGAWVPGHRAAEAVTATMVREQNNGSAGEGANVKIFCGSGSSNSSAGWSKSTGDVHRSAGRPVVQHQARARAGNNSMSRLSEETGPAGGTAGKVLAPGQKRQALCELGPQRVKHSQKDMPAWTQSTDDSDF